MDDAKLWKFVERQIRHADDGYKDGKSHAHFQVQKVHSPNLLKKNVLVR